MKNIILISVIATILTLISCSGKNNSVPTNTDSTSVIDSCKMDSIIVDSVCTCGPDSVK